MSDQERPVYVLVVGHDITDRHAERIQQAVSQALVASDEAERADCERCGARLVRASWRLPWTASDSQNPVWCVIDNVWQPHQPRPEGTPT